MITRLRIRKARRYLRGLEVQEQQLRLTAAAQQARIAAQGRELAALKQRLIRLEKR